MRFELEMTSKGSRAHVAAQGRLLFDQLSRGS